MISSMSRSWGMDRGEDLLRLLLDDSDLRNLLYLSIFLLSPLHTLITPSIHTTFRSTTFCIKKVFVKRETIHPAMTFGTRSPSRFSRCCGRRSRRSRWIGKMDFRVRGPNTKSRLIQGNIPNVEFTNTGINMNTNNQS